MSLSRIVHAVVLSSWSLQAQTAGITTGDLKGCVQAADTLEAIPGATLVLEHVSTGDVRTLGVDAQGKYRFRLVPSGVYDLRVEAPGYAPRRLKALEVPIGTLVVLDIELSRQLEAFREVQAAPAGADPTRTQVASVIHPLLLENLPIQRRTFVDFSLTVPGVTRSSTPVTGAVPSSGLSFRGMNPRQNRFLVDGLDNNDLGVGAVACPISQGAVQEFQVITGAFSAEYGRAAGGIVNSVLKTGGKRISGSVFGFHRPGAWDAHSHEGADLDDFRQDQFGGHLGGPLLKDRLFFFASVERYRRNDIRTVAIDRAVLDSPSFARRFRLRNGDLPWRETQTSALVKFDYLQSDRSRWSLRVSRGETRHENQIPWGGIVARTAGGTRTSRNNQVAITHQWFGGERWLNEARFLYATQDSGLQSMDPDRTASVEITGAALFGTQRLTPQDTDTTYGQLTDTVTYLADRHTLKAGVDVLASWNRADVRQNTEGVYVFQGIDGLFPDALTAFGTGYPAAYLQSWGDPRTRFQAQSGAFFLQDDWQITPRFLLKLGMRYDWENLPRFDTSAYEELQNPPLGGGDPLLGPTRLPDGALSYTWYFRTEKDWSSRRWSPRVSFSWKIREPVRLYGGFGLFSGNTQLGALLGPRLYNNRHARTTLYTFLDDLPRILTGQAPRLPAYWAMGPAFAEPPEGTKPVLVIPGAYRMPRTRAWNLGLEWTPTPAHRITLDLLYARTKGLMNIRDVNAYVAYLNPLLGQVVYRRPDMRYSQILRVDGSGESRYFGQTLSWQWTVGQTLSLGVSYTHSRAEDNLNDWTGDFPLQDTFRPEREWGPSAEDQTHQIKVVGVFRSQSQHPLWRDWTVSVIGNHASGRPYSTLAGYDRNLNGDGSSDRPAGIRRNRRRGPATTTVDLRLARQVAWVRVKAEFIFEVFNLFNSTSVLKVQNVRTAPSPHVYGKPLVYGPMRQFQLGVKLDF